MNKIDELKEMIDDSNYIVAFTGAGVSTDSGLKDFRSEDGLYKKDYEYPAEYMLSHDCFFNHTDIFYDYYRENFNCLKYNPNDTHRLLKRLEDINKLKAIITQNIDGLHQKANSNNVYEIHGSIYRNYCVKCNKEYDSKYIFDNKDIPKCECGGLIKPDVVLYGESLPEEAYLNGIKEISKADMLLVEGSSLTVYPASRMLDYFRGKYLVILNNTETPYDYKANLVIHDNLAKVSKEILNYCK